MKTILIDTTLYDGMNKAGSILERADVKLFTGATNDELLSLHRAKKANLIVSRLDAPGMPSERLYDEIRNDAQLRAVSLILCCQDQAVDKMRAAGCFPNAVLILPLNSAHLLEKAQSLLSVSSRGAYRVLISVSLEVRKEKAFFCRSENISSTGLLLETDRRLSAGERLTCSFFLPGAKQLVLAGEIVRVLPQTEAAGMTKYGVKFSKLSPAETLLIDDFVKKKTGRI